MNPDEGLAPLFGTGERLIIVVVPGDLPGELGDPGALLDAVDSRTLTGGGGHSDGAEKSQRKAHRGRGEFLKLAFGISENHCFVTGLYFYHTPIFAGGKGRRQGWLDF